MNIVLYGDSYLGRFNKNKIDQLESRFDNATVYNCAVGGWSSSELARRAKYFALMRPDYVILSFGGNDVAPWKDIVPLGEFKKNVKTLLDAFQGSHIIMILCPKVNLTDSSQSKQFNDGLTEYYRSIQDLLEDSDVDVIDTNALLSGIHNYHEEDGVHFNDEAYGMIIAKISDLIS